VAQLQRDYIKAVHFQKFDERRLISINHDQIRTVLRLRISVRTYRIRMRFVD